MMEKFVKRVQEDIDQLQRAIEAERNAVLARLRDAATEAANQAGIPSNKVELERFIETRIQSIEPAMENFYRQLRSTAKSHGFDLSGLENFVENSAKKVQQRVKKMKTAPQKTSKASSKKTPPKKAAKKVAAKAKKTKTAVKKKATRKK